MNAAKGLPIEPPPGENFILARVEFDDPAEPCWNDGFDIMGTWKVISPALSQCLTSDPRAKHSTIHVFQGDEARLALAQGIAEEARYQQQQRAKPNN
jgi:hypothetical protein